MSEYLALKWGTMKAWNVETEASRAAAQRYVDFGLAAGGVIMQRDSHEQKLALCELIDAIDDPIHNEWSGELMTKEDAKLYVMEYQTP